MRSKLLAVAILLLASVLTFGQADKIYLHNGKVVEGTVIKVAEFTVVYKYLNEDAEQTISKYGVGKIIYGKSGRTEDISEKIVINSKDDWEKVVILEDKSGVAGLTKVGEIRGKTAMINYRTAAGNDKKSQEKLKKDAAEQGCPFILLTSDKDAALQSSSSMGWGRSQSTKKGIAYKY